MQHLTAKFQAWFFCPPPELGCPGLAQIWLLSPFSDSIWLGIFCEDFLSECRRGRHQWNLSQDKQQTTGRVHARHFRNEQQPEQFVEFLSGFALANSSVITILNLSFMSLRSNIKHPWGYEILEEGTNKTRTLSIPSTHTR